MRARDCVSLLREQARRLRSGRQWHLVGEAGDQSYMDLYALAGDLEALADLLEQGA